MKKIASIIFLLLALSAVGFSKNGRKKAIRDGLYLITKVDTIETKLSALAANEIAVSFSKQFVEFNTDEFIRIVIDTSQYVPLELEQLPTTEQQTEKKKKLLLSLTKEASEKLKTFTASHVLGRVAIVVGGEVLTMHKIKVPITSGQLQISRCYDNACERLFVKLKDDVRK